MMHALSWVLKTHLIMRFKLAIISSDCTNPFMIHFHTDAAADTVIAATIAQISRGWSPLLLKLSS